MVKSNYEILGITEGASRNEIRSAFRNLALTHHADSCLLYTSDAADD